MLFVPAYAKVNLALEVLARRVDGYHEIATVVSAVDWHDLVGVHAARGAGRVDVSIIGGEQAWVAPGAVIHSAATALVQLTGSAADLIVRVHKRLPAASGLGGGSADAAAVLRAGAAALRRVGVALDPADLLPVAASLGSDVPALLVGGTVLATGRGEQLRPLPAPSLHLAVAVAGASSTAAVYAALCDPERGANGRAVRLATALADGQPPADADLGSDLEAAACRATPLLGEALVSLRRLVPGVAWHLTGSGGAAFSLARDRHAAAKLVAAAQGAGFTARPCHTVCTPLIGHPRVGL